MAWDGDFTEVDRPLRMTVCDMLDGEHLADWQRLEVLLEERPGWTLVVDDDRSLQWVRRVAGGVASDPVAALLTVVAPGVVLGYRADDDAEELLTGTGEVRAWLERVDGPPS